jgi:hypothetical protein
MGRHQRILTRRAELQLIASEMLNRARVAFADTVSKGFPTPKTPHLPLTSL